MNNPRHDIVVIGGGVIGMNIAYKLAKSGRDVALIEPDELGMGASYGNAGTIADYATIPLGTPNVLRDLPRLMFDRESPLSIHYSVVPRLLPWLIQFAFQSLPGPSRANAKALGQLLNNANALWRTTAEELGASHLLHQRGCLYLYDSENAFIAAKADEKMRRDNGVALEVISASEVLQLEPGLSTFQGGAHYFPDATSIDDPGALMKTFASRLNDLGMSVIKARANNIVEHGQYSDIHCDDNLIVSARKVVIAAGAHSRALARSVGENVTLDTERGYHLEFDMPKSPVSRPVCSARRGFYASPMNGRLRIAGTVEFGGVDLPASPQRLAMLERGARELLPQLGEVSRAWLGFRPSVPNSVPIIRRSKRSKHIILAFGHGHIGVTLAPVTATMVQALI
ncbi:NAD(P)/FAD-dependent oxidoreductase [Granulosicoccus antarcticus]|uniref:D-amino acid dehydrogenase 1 n=1 Tax=Granulosicoccus antarcticus IMCC3135 TaxID=1192854 RepID=A0A2Z2P308_9GAMM|nr:FAD-dependent oxidoreductase [Granulosicoccus antarcticus]ASJ74124.1 D-amino acid dehydrogenase 1 [Granulosicoccus antarcticus IMCC3135]